MDNGIFNAREQLGWPKTLALGFQHVFAMFGATILVPILVRGFFIAACGEAPSAGLTIAVTLFCAGAGTLLFHLCTKWKVPAFLGSSFAFLGGFATIANLKDGIYANMSINDRAAYACGGVVIAGSLYLIMAAIIRLVGVKRVMRFLPPVVTGPVIILIGLGLSGSAINNAKMNPWLAVITFTAVVGLTIYGKSMAKIVPILLGIIVAYIAAIIMNACGMKNTDGSAILNFGEVAAASFIGTPEFQICKFDPSAILTMAPIAMASMMEHIGDISAISATVGANFVANPGLHRTLLGDGLATMLAGVVGGPANTTYGENTGVLALTKVYDPFVIRVAAVIAIIMSFIPKVSALISTLPTALIGGVSIVLYGMISAIGVRNIVENKVDLSKSRNTIIVATILVLGLGLGDGITFKINGVSLTLTALAVASLTGILLNAILPGKDYEFEDATNRVSEN